MVKNKKLLIILSQTESFGGVEKYVRELIKAVKPNFEITLCSAKGKIINKNIFCGLGDIKICFFNVIKVPILLDRVPLTKSGIKLIFNLDKYDCIYLPYFSTLTIIIFLFILKIKKSSTKIIFGIHDPLFFNEYFLRKAPHSGNNIIRKFLLKIYLLISKFIISKIGIIHVLNKDDFKTLKKIKYKGKVYLIPNFLYYNKSDIKIYNNKSKFIVLFGGRLVVYHKGIDLLSDVIKRVLDKNNNIEFHIFGSGADGQKIIENLTKEFHKNVKYLGFISNKNVEREYENSSLYIMTSRIEAFPLVALEAQAHGLPVIAFDIKGPRDIIINFSGSLIKPFDTNQFANEILKYYNQWKNDKLGTKYKMEIVKYIFDKYSDKIIVPKVEKMLTD